MDELPDLMAAVANARNLPRPRPVENLVDDFATITAALDRAGVNLKADTKRTDATFMGVPIVENRYLPDGFAVIAVDGQVVTVLDLRAAKDNA